MRTSEKNLNVLKKLATVSQGLDPLKKDKKNPFYKSKYADHLQIWEALRTPCKEAGLLVTHGGGIHGSFAQKIDEDGAVVNVPFFNVQTRVTDIESGEWIETDCPLAIEKPTPQGCGSAFTYGSRYGTEGIFNMAREDDDGNAAETKPPAKKASPAPKPEPKPEPKKEPSKPSPDKGTAGYKSERSGCISIVGKDGKGKGQRGYLFVMMKKAGVTEAQLREHLSENYEWPKDTPMTHIQDLNTAEMNEVLEWFEEQKG